jgi:iron uptake system EfeUOB component EfeO/EfeM
MKNLRGFIAATALVAVLTFTGCASKNAEQQNTQVKEQPKVEELQNTLSISQGSQNMRDALKNMKEFIAVNNEEGTIKEGAKLEENWKVFEDNVKDKNKELYEKVEGPLGIINAAIKIKPIDTKILSSAIDSLDNILSEVEKIK